MAKIVVEFDTVEKTMSVTKDGAVIDNVVYASLGKRYSYDGDDDGYACELVTMTEDSDNDMRTITRLVASENGEFVSQPAQSFSHVEHDIVNFFRK